MSWEDIIACLFQAATRTLRTTHACEAQVAERSFSRLPTHPYVQWWNAAFATIVNAHLLPSLRSLIANRAEWSPHYYLKQCGFTIVYSQIHFLCESIIALVRITWQRSHTKTHKQCRTLFKT